MVTYFSLIFFILKSFLFFVKNILCLWLMTCFLILCSAESLTLLSWEKSWFVQYLKNYPKSKLIILGVFQIFPRRICTLYFAWFTCILFVLLCLIRVYNQFIYNFQQLFGNVYTPNIINSHYKNCLGGTLFTFIFIWNCILFYPALF